MISQILSIIQEFAIEVIAVALISLIVWLLGIWAQDKANIAQKIKIKYYKFRNIKESQFKVIVHYGSNEGFKDISEKLKNQIKEDSYGWGITDVNHNNSSHEFEVDNLFNIKLDEVNPGKYTIRTSKISSGIRNLGGKYSKLKSFFDDLERNFHLEREEMTIYLYLPFNESFVKPMMPKGVSVRSYDFALDSNSSASEITLTNDKITVSNVDGKNIWDIGQKFV